MRKDARVVPHLSSAVKMEAVWISQHVVMVTGTAVMEAMRMIVVLNLDHLLVDLGSSDVMMVPVSMTTIAVMKLQIAVMVVMKDTVMVQLLPMLLVLLVILCAEMDLVLTQGNDVTNFSTAQMELMRETVNCVLLLSSDVKMDSASLRRSDVTQELTVPTVQMNSIADV